MKQMQYMAWPDHGVPDDSSDFLEFVVKVRQCRTGMVEPTVVHCRSTFFNSLHYCDGTTLLPCEVSI